MNERIKELIEESKCLSDGYNTGAVDLDKFAELIVRECSAFVYNYPEKYLTRNQAREISMSMEERFGVEE
jgi:hypothetical protein